MRRPVGVGVNGDPEARNLRRLVIARFYREAWVRQAGKGKPEEHRRLPPAIEIASAEGGDESRAVQGLFAR
jgi:hypothetical protein